MTRILDRKQEAAETKTDSPCIPRTHGVSAEDQSTFCAERQARKNCEISTTRQNSRLPILRDSRVVPIIHIQSNPRRPVMSQMTAVQVSGPGGAFETVNRQVPGPGPHTVRIKIQACGVFHSDVFVKEGHWPGLQYPRVTGHEVAGVIDAVGPGVTIWKKGQRVGVGWHGGHCGQCISCRGGDFMGCQSFQVTGFQEDGGYAQYMIARSEAVAAIPDALSPVQAAPSSAQASQPSTACAIAEQRPAIWWRCRDWEDLDISASSSPTRWVFAPWQ